MISIGLLGCGRIGRLHAEIVGRHPAARLDWCFDVRREAADAVAAAVGGRVADRIEQVLDDPGVHAVLIATSTDTHADLLARAAQAGKAVFCEKPIDLDLAKVDACADLIADCHVPIQIGFNRRFDPGHRAAWEAARAGQIGELHQVIVTSRDPEIPPRSYLAVAGGLLRDMTIHDFDLARFMLGEEPVEVVAMIGALGDPTLADEGEADSAMIVLRTSSGRLCHINNSRSAVYGCDQRVELLGAAGMLLSDNRRPHELRSFGREFTAARAPLLHFFLERYREAFERQFESFVRAVRGEAVVEVGFEDGRRALVLAEAAYESVETGKSVRVAAASP